MVTRNSLDNSEKNGGYEKKGGFFNLSIICIKTNCFVTYLSLMLLKAQEMYFFSQKKKRLESENYGGRSSEKYDGGR